MVRFLIGPAPVPPPANWASRPPSPWDFDWGSYFDATRELRETEAEHRRRYREEML